MNKDYSKPDFIIVGAPKCGTTSLYRYLKEHPDIFMPVLKELNYFCFDLREENIIFYGKQFNYPGTQSTSYEKYLKLFAKAKDTQTVGEASVWYFTSLKAPQAIYDRNPRTKIIIMLREPVSLIHSYHSQMFFIGSEDIMDFEEAVRAEPLRREHKKLPKHIPWPSRLYYSEWSKLSHYVQNYYDVFPKEQVKVILIDDLKKDVTAVYKDVLEFIGVDSYFEPSFEVANARKSPRIKYSIHPSTKRTLHTLLPAPVKVYLNELANKINSGKADQKPIRPEFKLELMQEYQDDVERLSHLLQRDLSRLWGYSPIN